MYISIFHITYRAWQWFSNFLTMVKGWKGGHGVTKLVNRKLKIVHDKICQVVGGDIKYSCNHSESFEDPEEPPGVNNPWFLNFCCIGWGLASILTSTGQMAAEHPKPDSAVHYVTWFLNCGSSSANMEKTAYTQGWGPYHEWNSSAELLSLAKSHVRCHDIIQGTGMVPFSKLLISVTVVSRFWSFWAMQ